MWLRQLPHKARKLENRLYLSAPSLESYLDRRTLTTRLQRLAKAIVKQYSSSKRSDFFSTQRSMSSFSSAVSSFPRDGQCTADFLCSTVSLRSPQSELLTKTLLPSNQGSNSGGGEQIYGGLSSGSGVRTFSSQPLLPKELQHQHSRSSSISSHSLSHKRMTVSQENSCLHPGIITTTAAAIPSLSSGLKSHGAANCISDLEQAKVEKAQLQQQVLMNILRHEELDKHLQAPSQCTGPGMHTLQQQEDNSEMFGNSESTLHNNNLEPNTINYNLVQFNTPAISGHAESDGIASARVNQQLIHQQSQQHNSINADSTLTQQQQYFDFQHTPNVGISMDFGNSRIMPYSVSNAALRNELQRNFSPQSNPIQPQTHGILPTAFVGNNFFDPQHHQLVQSVTSSTQTILQYREQDLNQRASHSMTGQMPNQSFNSETDIHDATSSHETKGCEKEQTNYDASNLFQW